MVSWDTRRLSSWGYSVFNHPEICSGDQSNNSLLATISCSCSWRASRQGFGRNADFQAWSSASLARYAERPPCRATSRLTVDTARSRCWAIVRSAAPEASPREISSRSGSVSARSERLPEQTHRNAPPDSESTNAPCRRRARSHAATVPPSTGPTARSSAPQKAQTVYLASCNTTFREQTYIRWCCIDLLS